MRKYLYFENYNHGEVRKCKRKPTIVGFCIELRSTIVTLQRVLYDRQSDIWRKSHSHYLTRGFWLSLQPFSVGFPPPPHKFLTCFTPTTSPLVVHNPNYWGIQCLSLITSGQLMYPAVRVKSRVIGPNTHTFVNPLILCAHTRRGFQNTHFPQNP